MYCLKCGKKNSEPSAEFCGYCGGRLSNSKKQTMKMKTLVLIPIVLLITCVAWVSIISVSANATATKFLNEYETGNWDGMKKYELSDYSYLSSSTQELVYELLYSDQDDSHYSKVYREILLNSDISKSIIITLNDHSDVKLKIIGPDMSEIIKKSMKISNDKYNSILSDDIFTDIIIEEIQKKETQKTYNVTIPMIRIKGKWYIDYNSENVIDCLLCGLLSACKEELTNK